MKTFILKHKKILLACMLCALVVTLCCATFLTASAFTLSTAYTVTYTGDYLTLDDAHGGYDPTDYNVTSNDYTWITFNGQVYNVVQNASSFTVTNSLRIATLGIDDGSDTSDQFDDIACWLYFRKSTDSSWSYISNNTSKSGKSYTTTPLLIDQPGTYIFCTVVEYGDDSLSPDRSAFLTITIESDLPVDNPTKTGYVFTGWYTDKDCTIPFEGSTITEDITLYAGWRPAVYTIAFNANGGQGSMSSVTATYDVEVTLPSIGSNITRQYYVFKGWSKSADGSGKVYADASTNKNFTDVDGSTVTLYAVWELGQYTVNFNANGGQGSMSSQNIRCNTRTALSQNTFTKEGYYLKGWATSANGEVVYKDKQDVENISGSSTSITLYAVWGIQKLNVTFIVDGKYYNSTTVDWGTSVQDVIESMVNSALYTVDEGQELPN